MKIRRTIHPEQPGAKRWKRKYGKNLICVRYRYDQKRNKKLTTVEIIVEEKEWERRANRIPLNKIMPIIVMYNEIDISNLVKNAGGRWNVKEKVWELAYGEILSLGLEDRIVAGGRNGK